MISDTEECEEAGCVRPAGKKWGGRLVCKDHYDVYREQHEKQLRDLDDNY
ncbi:hypothetical protein HYU21_04560 [Candidatus Woesearchaeota archaeon]|nr:hypothetical protein [Candidatus Woesearchaeota archaeon]